LSVPKIPQAQGVTVTSHEETEWFGTIACIELHGRRIYLNLEETKKVRDELTKALRQFNAVNRKARKK
jgi:hypothetical protein